MEKQKLNNILIDIKCIRKYDEHIRTCYLKKWNIDSDEIVARKYIQISQSSTSLPLLWQNLFYPNPTTHFFLELVNAFQKLDTKEKRNIPYNSYSQAITTYCLKILARHNIIEIIAEQKKEFYNLSEFEQIFGNEQPHETYISLYDVQFYKIRNLTKEDIPLLQKVAASLNIDFSYYHIRSINKKIRLTLKARKIIITGAAFQKAIAQKEVLSSIIEGIKAQFRDIREEQYYSCNSTLNYKKKRN